MARAVFADDAAAGAKQKTGMMDRLIHADYQREGMALATFDRELALLPASRTFLAASPGQPTRAPDDFLRRPSSRDHSRSRAAVLLLRVDRQ